MAARRARPLATRPRRHPNATSPPSGRSASSGARRTRKVRTIAARAVSIHAPRPGRDAATGDMTSMHRYGVVVNTSSSGDGNFGYQNVWYSNPPGRDTKAKFRYWLKAQCALALAEPDGNLRLRIAVPSFPHISLHNLAVNEIAVGGGSWCSGTPRSKVTCRHSSLLHHKPRRAPVACAR